MDIIERLKGLGGSPIQTKPFKAKVCGGISASGNAQVLSFSVNGVHSFAAAAAKLSSTPNMAVEATITESRPSAFVADKRDSGSSVHAIRACALAALSDPTVSVTKSDEQVVGSGNKAK